ncbi:MAG: oxidoreductase [Actinobacteria bacterium]|nr:oxidoreductase [Actinomycetota bacterium]
MTGGTLVIGASHAGVELAATLRNLGDNDPITLVGEEAHAPYERPPLSKAFLAGATDASTLALRTPEFYEQRGIEVIRGHAVTEIAMTGTAGGAAQTDDGQSMPFDRLALAVGARPRPLEVPGADLAGVCYLRTVSDASALRERLIAAGHVVVIGGGFIGLEVASVARTVGASVTVVEVADRLLSRSVAPVVSDFYRAAHSRRGVDVLLGVGAARLYGEAGQVAGVELEDGRRLAADVVVVGVGITPCTELAQQLGLECDGGIVVDAHGRTNLPSVVAAGDCTVSPHPVSGDGRYRLESVPNATTQARAAAAALLGAPLPPPAVPWFWSDQYDLKLQIAGIADGYDSYVLRDATPDSISVLYYRNDRLIAVNAVNRAADYFDVRRVLAQGGTVPADRAGEASLRLGSSAETPSLVPGPAGAGGQRREAGR